MKVSTHVIHSAAEADILRGDKKEKFADIKMKSICFA